MTSSAILSVSFQILCHLLMPNFLQDHFLVLKWDLNQNTIKHSFVRLICIFYDTKGSTLWWSTNAWTFRGKSASSSGRHCKACNRHSGLRIRQEGQRGSGIYWMCFTYQVFCLHNSKRETKMAATFFWEERIDLCLAVLCNWWTI